VTDKKKIIGVDNYGRESVADFLVCEGVANDYVGELIVNLLNSNDGASASTFYHLVPADHKLWGGMAEFV
jgi:hypothetical protein